MQWLVSRQSGDRLRHVIEQVVEGTLQLTADKLSSQVCVPLVAWLLLAQAHSTCVGAGG